VNQEHSPWTQKITSRHKKKQKQKITLVKSNQQLRTRVFQKKEIRCVIELSLDFLDEPGDTREEGKRKGQKPTILPTSERGKNAQRCQQKLSRYKKLPIVQGIEIFEASC
jgi:hypothetical protein